METTADLTQGISERLGQFSLRVLLVFATGLTVGSDRTVVPVLGEAVLRVTSSLAIVSFVVSFGVVKSIFNRCGGKRGEEYGREHGSSLGGRRHSRCRSVSSSPRSGAVSRS